MSNNKITVTPKGLVLEHHNINGFQYLTCPNQTTNKGKRLAENPIFKH